MQLQAILFIITLGLWGIYPNILQAEEADPEDEHYLQSEFEADEEKENEDVEVEIGGDVSSYLRSMSSNQNSFEETPTIEMAGSEKKVSRTFLVFDEAAFEAQVNRNITSYWQAIGRLELTVSKEEDDVEVEIDDASIGFQNQWLQVVFGIIDDPSDEFFLGEVDEFSVGELENGTIDSDVPGFRLGYVGNENLILALTHRARYNKGDREVPLHQQTQWRFDTQYEADWGRIQGVHDRTSSNVEDAQQFSEETDQDAGKYVNQANLSHVVFQGYFLNQAMNPFITYGVLNTQQRDALRVTEPQKSVEESVVIGLDWRITNKNTLTFVSNTQTRKKNDFARFIDHEQQQTETLQGMGVGINHSLEKLEFLVNYSSATNNRSKIKTHANDLEFQVIDFRVNVEF